MAFSPNDSSRVKSLLSNSSWNLMGFATSLISQLLILRITISWIGVEDFGQASLIIALWLPANILGVVIAQSATREMSTHIGAGDLPSANNVFYAALIICTTLSLLIAILLILIGPKLSTFFPGIQLSKNEIRDLIFVTAIGTICKQIGFLMQAATAAEQNFRRIAIILTFGSASTIAITLLITYYNKSTFGYLLGLSLALVSQLAIWIPSTLAKHKPVALLHLIKSKETQSLISFGKWQLLAQTLGATSNQTDRYALGAFANASAIGQYSAVSRLQEAAYMGIMKIADVLLPHFGATSSDSSAKRFQFFQTATWAVTLLGVACFAPIIPLADKIVELWIGPESTELGAIIIQTLAIASIIGCASNVFTTCAMGLGRSKIVAEITLLYSIAAIFSTTLLIWIFGAKAAASGLIIAGSIRLLISMRYTEKHLFPKCNLRLVATSTTIPIVAGLILIALNHVLPTPNPQNLQHTILTFILYSSATLIIAIPLTASTRNGRIILQQILNPIFSAKGNSKS